ncbi:YceI family protein [Planosporangium thailandense]|uniref:YceI family protein n=1 Tax=Planosporangium thailandense TaxID=765197 RepID=A0ABX0Y4Y3_9ACTN|nr:YceI family protein [Planosporangium thailandense]
MTPQTTAPTAGAYRVVADRSTVRFQTNHLFGLTNITGVLAVRSGRIVIAEPLAASTATATVDAASFTTLNRRRDAAVRSAKFLDTARHPDITFTSHGLRRYAGQWVLHGDLTVRAATQPVELTITHARTRDGALRVRATALIDRYAFGLTRARFVTARHLNVVVDVSATRE